MSRAQSLLEEKANMITHAVGLVVALLVCALFNVQSVKQVSMAPWVATNVFCAALILQYLISALYHGAKPGTRKVRLHIWDHALIYVLIAGSYTPFCTMVLPSSTGWIFLASLWAFAFLGVLFKIRWTGRFQIASTLIYLFMGWAAVFVYRPFVEGLSRVGLVALVVGGIMYSIGAFFFMCDKLRFYHAIWHLFVLAGSFSHVVAVATLIY